MWHFFPSPPSPEAAKDKSVLLSDPDNNAEASPSLTHPASAACLLGMKQATG